MPPQQSKHSGKELFLPLGAAPGGYAKRQQRVKRLAAHGRNVAEAPGHQLVSQRTRRMDVTVEMRTFDQEVGRDQEFLTKFEATQHGCIVPNPDSNAVLPLIARSPGRLTNFLYEK